MLPMILIRETCLTINATIASIVGDHFLYSLELDVLFSRETVRRDEILIRVDVFPPNRD